MSWARIMAPLSGGERDAAALAAAVVLAEPFGAEVTGVYTPADVADVMPWMGEGFMGGVQATALESLKEAAAIGERRARAALEACGYAKGRFVALQTPVWAGLSAEGRLSDVIVFTNESARGRGPLAEAFQQMVADEQRPVLIAREGLKADGCVMVAWDGGKEASRAARLSLPLLEKAQRVVITSAPKASTRQFDPRRLQSYCAQRGVDAELQVLSETGDVARALLEAASAAKADILVAGAFGHPRLQEFIFGGTTRTLLNSERPSLFLSH
ncbi:MAG: universal stress protein UspA [Phenylobacterium sp.]|nr:universal stress protein UspA [Phenylobacterium sp.]